MTALFLADPCVCEWSSSATCWAAIVSEKPNVAKVMSRMAIIFVFKQLHLHMWFYITKFFDLSLSIINTIKSFLLNIE